MKPSTSSAKASRILAEQAAKPRLADMQQERDAPPARQHTFLSDVVMGMSDGLTVPFALTAGLAGAGWSDNSRIIIAGFVVSALSAAAMGVSGYLAHRAASEEEVHKGESPEVFTALGLSKETQDIIAREMSRDDAQWTDFVRRFELAPDTPSPKTARQSALTIAAAYIAGGLVPILPYYFTSTSDDGLKWSACITVCCLALFGYLKAKATGFAPWPAALRELLIGSAAAGAAFLIAGLFTK